MKQYYVYMLASRSRRRYVGMTSDLERRVSEHKKKAIPGFTSQYSIDRLVWYESTNGALGAAERERQLKKWRRSKKVWLIEMENLEWLDLAAGFEADVLRYSETRDPSTPLASFLRSGWQGACAASPHLP